MRIQLDYYRILGITPNAQLDQINQAHSDRLKSLPRREYSDKAISARQKLLDQAHRTLADTEQRQTYDAQILPQLIKSRHEHTFFIEIDKRHLSGAMLILFELGEYDQIIELSKATASINSNDSDLTLSIVLAYLELGRESWNQSKYEQAFKNFDLGLSILKTAKKNTQLPELNTELQGNISKLRPYRILELLAAGQNPEGLGLFQELLGDRLGIEGKGDDRSGLDTDKFLEFILQLRTYLTTSEQKILFDQEAARPSMVAYYLEIYALIAEGLSLHEPAIIAQAQRLLIKIHNSQNVYLDQAICALLLGQITEVTELLNLSDETEKIATIQQLSKPEHDLVKGLYNFTQNWLNTEIYPNFKNLKTKTADLDAYFNDDRVQSYIDKSIDQSTDKLSSSIPSSEPEIVFPSFKSRLGYSNFESKEPRELKEPAAKSRENAKSDRQSNQTSNQSNTKTVVAQRIKNPRTKTRYRIHLGRLILFLIISISTISGSLALGFMGWNYFFPKSKIAIAQSEIVLTPIITASIANIPPIKNPDPNLASTLDRKAAGEIVANWQKIKAEALGSKFKLTGLEQTLAEPLLSEWRSRAQDLKESNSYLEYILKSAVVKEFKSIDKNQVSAITNISEVRNYFNNGKLVTQESQADNYQVEYVLTKIGDRWLISAMNIQKPNRDL